MAWRVVGVFAVFGVLLAGASSAQMLQGRSAIRAAAGRPPAPAQEREQRPASEPTRSDPAPGTQDRDRSRHSRDQHANPPAAPSGGDLFLAGPRTYGAGSHTYAPGYDRPARPIRGYQRLHRGYGYLYGSDLYAPFPAGGSLIVPGSYAARVGYLQLDVRPSTAQVWIDGIYFGTGGDFGEPAAAVALEAGIHRVEVREPGFHPVTFDVRIAANETIGYRKELERIEDQVVEREYRPATPPGAPKTFYVIPRCYAGDTPPRALELPAGCDAADVRKRRATQFTN